MRALLACAAAGEPSAARVRAAALGALCSLLRDEEAPRGPDAGAAVLDALLAAADGIFEGLPAVLDARLRSRCAAEFDRLDLLDPAHAGVPIRARPRYESLGLEARLAKLRSLWERRAEQGSATAERTAGGRSGGGGGGGGGSGGGGGGDGGVGGGLAGGSGSGVGLLDGSGGLGGALSGGLGGALGGGLSGGLGGFDPFAAGANPFREVFHSGLAGPEPLSIPVRVGSICEDLTRAVGRLDASRLARSRNMVRFTLDHGHDAGGLQRHVFSEFGKGLLNLLAVSAAADALAAARTLLKGWEPAMTARPQGRDEAEMLSRLREIVAAAPALLAGGNGGLLTARPPGESISGGGCAPVAPPVAPPVVPPVAPPAAWSDGRQLTIVEQEAFVSSLPPPPPRSGASAPPSAGRSRSDRGALSSDLPAKRRRTELPPIVEGAPMGLMEVRPAVSPPPSKRPISHHPTPPHLPLTHPNPSSRTAAACPFSS